MLFFNKNQIISLNLISCKAKTKKRKKTRLTSFNSQSEIEFSTLKKFSSWNLSTNLKGNLWGRRNHVSRFRWDKKWFPWNVARKKRCKTHHLSLNPMPESETRTATRKKRQTRIRMMPLENTPLFRFLFLFDFYFSTCENLSSVREIFLCVRKISQIDATVGKQFPHGTIAKPFWVFIFRLKKD